MYTRITHPRLQIPYSLDLCSILIFSSEIEKIIWMMNWFSQLHHWARYRNMIVRHAIRYFFLDESQTIFLIFVKLCLERILMFFVIVSAWILYTVSLWLLCNILQLHALASFRYSCWKIKVLKYSFSILYQEFIHQRLMLLVLVNASFLSKVIDSQLVKDTLLL